MKITLAIIQVLYWWDSGSTPVTAMSDYVEDKTVHSRRSRGKWSWQEVVQSLDTGIQGFD
jgi:hypothetical protein